jgi:hypothetical protein
MLAGLSKEVIAAIGNPPEQLRLPAAVAIYDAMPPQLGAT